MIPAATRDKRFHVILAVLAAWMILGTGCASEPSAPTDENSAPTVVSISVSGSRPVIAAGTINLLVQAETADIDGDALSFTWSGDGHFHDQDDLAKTVRWDVPAGSYGDLSVTCTVSDGSEEGTRTRSFEVGRSLSAADYGDLVGQTVTWSTADAPFYILQGDVTIPAGITLVVEESVTVWCDSGRDLKINGSLVVAGDSYGKVNFKAYAPDTDEKDYWDGIVFESGDGSIDMSWCNIDNAGTSVSMALGSGTGALIENCGFFNCLTAISANFSDLTVRFCTVSNATKGFNLAGSEVEIEGCQFLDTLDPALQIVGATEGSCVGSHFTDFSPPAISISGGSYVTFHENRFYGDDLAILVGGSYGADPLPMDGRCNYWDEGATAVDIEARIENQGSDSPDFLFTPWQATLGAECSGGDGPVALTGIEVIFDARHPLYADPPGGVDLSVMAADGYPRLLRVDVDDEDAPFVHDFDWSTGGNGQFFVSATSWPPYPPEETMSYAGQADDVDGTEIFFVAVSPAEADDVTLTITDNWGTAIEVEALFDY